MARRKPPKRRERPAARNDPGAMMVIRGCWAKIAHPTREAAEFARSDLERSRGQGFAYQCPACSKWHVTKQPQRSQDGFEAAS